MHLESVLFVCFFPLHCMLFMDARGVDAIHRCLLLRCRQCKMILCAVHGLHYFDTVPVVLCMSAGLRVGVSWVLVRSLPALFTLSRSTERSASSSCSSCQNRNGEGQWDTNKYRVNCSFNILVRWQWSVNLIRGHKREMMIKRWQGAKDIYDVHTWLWQSAPLCVQYSTYTQIVSIVEQAVVSLPSAKKTDLGF